MQEQKQLGFTLVELAIVLVIIGLLVGGVLVGRDLIRQSEITALVSQVDKFHAATNTFIAKYGGLPGDLSASKASEFGFAARGTIRGQGDGSGIIEGVNCPVATGCTDYSNATYQLSGETVAFWVDLSSAGLIPVKLSTALPTHYNSTMPVTTTSTPSLTDFYPSARIQNNYFYVYSDTSNRNWYGLSGIYQVQNRTIFRAEPGLTVEQAHKIDEKIDDHFPQTGNVLAQHVNYYGIVFARGGGSAGAIISAPSTTAATAQSATTCFDNGNTAGATQKYSLAYNGGAEVNCALSFRFQ